MLEDPKSEFTHVVLQATENSIPFYETMGFIRVGCVSRPDPPAPDDLWITTTVETTVERDGPVYKDDLPEFQDELDLDDKCSSPERWLLYWSVAECARCGQVHPGLEQAQEGQEGQGTG